MEPYRPCWWTGRRPGGRLGAMTLRRPGPARGVTLIEVLVAIALVALLFGGAMMGLGAIGSARLREATDRKSVV